jgi:hypothetical protein
VSNAKDLVGDRQFIDIREWHRAKLLEPSPGKDKEFTLHWEGGEWVRSVSVEVKPEQVVLSYQDRLPGDKPEWRETREWVDLSFSSCNYGGRRRPWFICPMPDCRRRVAVLYLDEGSYFVCRGCASLTYQCRRLDRRNRALLHSGKIRERLGGSSSVTDPFPNRPKGMRRVTYNRLKAKADELELKGAPQGLNRAEKKAASRIDHSLAALLSDPKECARILKILEAARRKRESLNAAATSK